MELTPENTTNKDVNWTSSDESVLTVSADGTVTAKKTGKATITAIHKDLQDSCEIEVFPIKADTVEIFPSGKYTWDGEDETKIRVNKNDDVSFSAQISPMDTMDKSIKWMVSNPQIASIDENGRLTILSKGNVTVTCETENGKKDSISIEVYDNNGIKAVVALGGAAGIGGGVYAMLKKKKEDNE